MFQTTLGELKMTNQQLNSIDISHQHFFYYDEENNLKTTMEDWPKLQPLSTLNNANHTAINLLLIIKLLVQEEKVLQISRSIVFKKSQHIIKNAKSLNSLLFCLYELSYIHFQIGGKYGRKQFITLNTKVFL